MITIWRFELPLDGRPRVVMPRGALVLSVGPPRQGLVLDLWAIVDPDEPDEVRRFLVVGTGHPLPYNAGRFIGTTHSHEGALIWHVFEATQLDPE